MMSFGTGHGMGVVYAKMIHIMVLKHVLFVAIKMDFFVTTIFTALN